MNKQPRSMETRIKQSKMLPWCKRFFLFVVNQGVHCQKGDLKIWTKAVVIQKQLSEGNKSALATCSFVASASRQLPKLQGTAENVLRTLSETAKAYGEILWFLIIDEKLFVILNIYTKEQALKILRDVESKQVHGDVIRSLVSDIYRGHTSSRSGNKFVVTFCHSDIVNIRKVTGAAAPIHSDEKVSPFHETIKEVECPSFVTKQRVEVFSKTTKQWVEAKVISVQKDDEGIFVTVSRIDGLELEYDIAKVRPINDAPFESDAFPIKATEDTGEKWFCQLGSLKTPGSDYLERDDEPNYMAPAMINQSNSEAQVSVNMISDSDMFKMMETFHIFDNIRSVQSWLQRELQENEALPRLVAEEINEMVKLYQKSKQGK